MGGYGGEVRGKAKIETYLRYVEKCEEWDLSHSPEPTMVWDDKRKEWVLEFRFSK